MSISTLARKAVLASVVLLTAIPPTAASAAPAATLPQPTGSQSVGTVTLHMVDRSRSDPWVPSQARELMVSLWYPTARPEGRTAPYMTAEEAGALLEGQKITGVPREALSGTKTTATSGAPPAGRKGELPLVVLSPGFTMPRSSLTGLAENLASHGYVVVGIDHTYESFGTSLPGGRMATCVACAEQTRDVWKFGDKAVRGRQADVAFVVDQLIGRHSVWQGARLIDPARIAMAGHSLGGAATTWTMLKDKRIRAGVNMDGAFFVPIPRRGLPGPFLMLGAGEVHEPGGKDFTWKRDWARMTGWKRWLTIDGGDHASFTDYALLIRRSERSMEITRAYLTAFMDLHLRKRPQPLFETPSPRYPEVKFWK